MNITTLNAEQLAAAQWDENKPDTTVVLAGPGSGKTATLIARIFALSAAGYKVDNMVIITYTNAAAKEIRSRLGEHADAIGYVGTLHGFGLLMLRNYGRYVGIEGGRIAVIDEDEAKRLLEDCVDALGYKGTKKDLAAAMKIGPLEWINSTVELSPPQLVVLKYWGTLIKNDLLDYDTILTMTEKLSRYFKDHPELGFPWRDLFVDEMQDASDVDTAIYEQFPFARKFFVGDPDQAIYGFRGGKPSNLNRLATTPENHSVILQWNYRCAGSICDVANRIIQTVPGRILKDTLAVNTEFGEIRCRLFDSEELELADVSNNVKAFWDRGHQSIAVLARMNSIVAQFVKALKARDVPVQTREPVEFPDDWRKARLLVSLLAAPSNDAIGFRYLQIKFGKEEAEQVKLKAGMMGLNKFYFHFDPKMSVASAITMLACEGISQDSCDRMRDVASRLVENYRDIGSLALAANSYESAFEETGEGVLVTTLHSAKGREFDVVFLPAWNEGVLPSPQAQASPKLMAEETRLAFVGVTRARHILCVSAANQRMNPWTKKFEEHAPSRFLDQLGTYYGKCV